MSELKYSSTGELHRWQFVHAVSYVTNTLYVLHLIGPVIWRLRCGRLSNGTSQCGSQDEPSYFKQWPKVPWPHSHSRWPVLLVLCHKIWMPLFTFLLCYTSLYMQLQMIGKTHICFLMWTPETKRQWLRREWSTLQIVVRSHFFLVCFPSKHYFKWNLIFRNIMLYKLE